MPNRILKESICTSDNVDQLSPFAEITFYRLIVNCDDYGRMDARAKILKSRLFPLKDIKDNVMLDALTELVKANLIMIYYVEDKAYLQMKTWENHQQVRAKRSKYPSPNDNTCNQMISDDGKCPRNPIQSLSLSESESESESNIYEMDTRKKRFTPPTIADVEAYCDEKGIYGFDAQYFIDYYTARGWMIGKNKIKSWQACIRTWLRNDEKRAVAKDEYDIPY